MSADVNAVTEETKPVVSENKGEFPSLTPDQLKEASEILPPSLRDDFSLENVKASLEFHSFLSMNETEFQSIEKTMQDDPHYQFLLALKTQTDATTSPEKFVTSLVQNAQKIKGIDPIFVQVTFVSALTNVTINQKVLFKKIGLPDFIAAFIAAAKNEDQKAADLAIKNKLKEITELSSFLNSENKEIQESLSSILTPELLNKLATLTAEKTKTFVTDITGKQKCIKLTEEDAKKFVLDTFIPECEKYCDEIHQTLYQTLYDLLEDDDIACPGCNQEPDKVYYKN